MILHLVSKTEWNAKPANQPYVPDAFAKDGFIHCTQGDALLLEVANRFYKSVPGAFIVLNIDETKVTSPIRWEPSATVASSTVPPTAEVPKTAASTTVPPVAVPPNTELPANPVAATTTATTATTATPPQAAVTAVKTGEPAEPGESNVPAEKAVELPPEVRAEFGTQSGTQNDTPTAPPNAPAPAVPDTPAPPLQGSPSPQPQPQPQPPQPPLFPHIYGPLNRDAIVGIRRMVRASNGTFTGIVMLESAPPAQPPQPSQPSQPPQAQPPQTRLKTPSELANELVDATGDFSEALSRYKDKIEAHMDELDKNIKDL